MRFFFSRGDSEACSRSHSYGKISMFIMLKIEIVRIEVQKQHPVNSPATFLIDNHNFFHSQYAYEFFAASPNEIVLYNNGMRFRYLPRMQADLTRPISHSWFRTALDLMLQNLWLWRVFEYVLRKLFSHCKKTFFKGFPEESKASTFEALTKYRREC